MKRLLNGALLFGCLTVGGFAGRAEALPPGCWEICECGTPCSTRCYNGVITITCGTSGMECGSNCPSRAVAKQETSPQFTHGCSEAKAQPSTHS